MHQVCSNVPQRGWHFCSRVFECVCSRQLCRTLADLHQSRIETSSSAGLANGFHATVHLVRLGTVVRAITFCRQVHFCMRKTDAYSDSQLVVPLCLSSRDRNLGARNVGCHLHQQMGFAIAQLRARCTDHCRFDCKSEVIRVCEPHTNRCACPATVRDCFVFHISQTSVENDD